MKTTIMKWFVILSAVALLASYVAFTRGRIQQLEARIVRLEAERDQKRAGVSYAFDESFIKYFGDQGVAEVERALKLLQQPLILQQPQQKQDDRL